MAVELLKMFAWIPFLVHLRSSGESFSNQPLQLMFAHRGRDFF